MTEGEKERIKLDRHGIVCVCSCFQFCGEAKRQHSNTDAERVRGRESDVHAKFVAMSVAQSLINWRIMKIETRNIKSKLKEKPSFTRACTHQIWQSYVCTY